MTQKALLQSAGDGTAVPSGYVGEIYDQTIDVGVTINLNTWTQLGSGFTLGPGVWLISVCGRINGTQAITKGQIGWGTGSSPAFGFIGTGVYCATTGASNISMVAPTAILNLSVSTTFKVWMSRGDGAANDFGIYNYRAVRIA